MASGAEDDELNHKRIVGALDAQLSSKGLEKVDRSADPDVLVAYHATFDRDLEINGFSSGWGGYRFGGMRSGNARAQGILVGTLVVDVVNPRTNNIVWRGIASKDIDGRNMTRTSTPPRRSCSRTTRRRSK